ncbi:hypothetical protein ACJX0J_000017 [Zea mays]
MTDFNLPSIFVPLVGLKRRGQIFSMYFQDHNTDIFFSFYTQMKNKVNAISESKKVNYLGKNMISAVCAFSLKRFFTPREIEQKAAELAYFLRYQLQFLQFEIYGILFFHFYTKGLFLFLYSTPFRSKKEPNTMKFHYLQIKNEKKKALPSFLYLVFIVLLPWEHSETFLTDIQEKRILEGFIELEELFLLDEMIKEKPKTHINEDHLHIILHFSTNIICLAILSGSFFWFSCDSRHVNRKKALSFLTKFFLFLPAQTRKFRDPRLDMENRKTFSWLKEQMIRSISPVDIEVPQAVLPDTVFEAVLRIPYDMQLKQVLANGKKGGLNVIGNLSFQSYRPNKKIFCVIGPVPGKKYSEIVFPILSPDPATKKDVHFLKYPIYVGGNRGRGQIYPDGSRGGYEISIVDASDGRQVIDIITSRARTSCFRGESIKLDQPLTSNPNVGGFGQGMQKYFLVLKKKQFEKVQLYEMNF